LEHYAGSELATIMASSFYRFHYPFHYQECVCYARALRKLPNIDTRFYIQARLQRLQQSDGNGLGPVERILFERELRGNAQLRVEAYRLMQNLWEIMSEATPDLMQIEETGMALQTTLQSLETSFVTMLELNPESTKTLRGYAQHLTDVVN